MSNTVPITGAAAAGCCLFALVWLAFEVYIMIWSVSDAIAVHPQHEAVDIVVFVFVFFSLLGSALRKART